MTTADDLLRNPRSDRVKAVAALGRRAFRERRGEFVVEGPQGVRELLGWAPSAARALYLTEAAALTHRDLVDAASAAGVPRWCCTEEVLLAMAGTPTPQGVVAVAARLDVPAEQALDGVASDRGFVVVLSAVRDPGNAGTVIRGAAAFGAAAVLVSDGSVDLYNPKTVRSSAGSLFHVPVSLGGPVERVIDRCRDAGLNVLAADGAGASALPEVDLGRPHAWVMGNEAWGLPEPVRRLCDQVVAIPIQRAESLNLAMAATVCLHASAGARYPVKPPAGRSLD